jgi:hypothetical protein
VDQGIQRSKAREGENDRGLTATDTKRDRSTGSLLSDRVSASTASSF